jgi:hypothetical protein
MKAKILLRAAALCYTPLLVAGNEGVYPKEQVAQFVIEKLDVTSLPSALRPKKEKGKKSLRTMDSRRRASPKTKPSCKKRVERGS